MTDMNGNAQCLTCGYRGERGIDVVLYKDRADGRVCLLCEDCATIIEGDGVELDRLADQSGVAA